MTFIFILIIFHSQFHEIKIILTQHNQKIVKIKKSLNALQILVMEILQIRLLADVFIRFL